MKLRVEAICPYKAFGLALENLEPQRGRARPHSFETFSQPQIPIARLDRQPVTQQSLATDLRHRSEYRSDCARVRSRGPPGAGIQLFENELVDSVADGVGLSKRLAKIRAGWRRGVRAINCSQGIGTSAGFRLQGVGAIERSGEALGARPRARRACCATYFGEGEVAVVGGGEGDITLESREIICCGVGSLEASQPPPSASISCTLAVIC